MDKHKKYKGDNKMFENKGTEKEKKNIKKCVKKVIIAIIAIIAIIVIGRAILLLFIQASSVVHKVIIVIIAIIAIIVIGGAILLRYIQDSSELHKPIIYLYPEEETQISVELPQSEQLTVSYPKYTDGWDVVAKENGDLIDLETGRNLYSLYYESENIVNFKVEKEGFVIKGEDSAEFLEEKLEILGLTEREAEEFIIYWLPKLEENEYNYIRFANEEEIEENMPLKITPEPDTVIRVMMTFKGLEAPIEVEEQKLETPERTGFVAVEWGGTEIK